MNGPGQTVALVLAVFAVTAPAPSAAEPVATETQVLGPFTGFDATLHPDNAAPVPIAWYGTDLGWSYAHGGKLHFLFGDSHKNDKGEPIGGDHDDAFGTIDLAAWPDPSVFGPGKVPPIRIGQEPGSPQVSLIDPGRPLEEWKTPNGAFSNGEREFGMFITGKPTACRADADCPGGFRCEGRLGFTGVDPKIEAGLTLSCAEDWPGCTADTLFNADNQPVSGSGMCVDRTSTMAVDTNFGRVVSATMKLLIGVRSTTDPRRYTDVREWITSKFVNVASRPVADFAPERGAGRARQDYRNIPGAGAGQRVFLWGRPWFNGVNARNQTLGMYFAWVNMPAGPGFEWQPNYYTGTAADGTPQFSTSEIDAAPVDLDSARPGVQPQEVHDLVQHMSIVWIEEIGKWVMFYGGGVSRFPYPSWAPTCGVLELFARDECQHVDMGNGALRMRTADDPWGPWSPPQDLIVGGDPYALPPADQYAPGGALHHPACRGAGCQARSAQIPEGDYGWFYGANIIEEWTRPAAGGVDLIWLASTWNPYRVIMLRTTITP
jgi:hypothetical protein